MVGLTASAQGQRRFGPPYATAPLGCGTWSVERVAKIKTVGGRRWHQRERYWTVPRTDGAISHLLALFAGEPVEVEDSLRPVQDLDDRPLPLAVSHSKLVDRLRDALRSRHYSRRTEQSYSHWVRRFLLPHAQPPEEMAEAAINAFLSHLALGKI